MASCLGLSVGRAHLQIVERPILYACRSAGETERISRRPGLRTCPVLQSKLKARAKEYTNPGDLQGAKATHEEQVGSEGLGVVIVDHGSRQPSSNAMLVEFVELYK